MANENKVAGRFLNRLQIIIDRQSRVLRDLEFDGSSSLPLKDRCPVHGSPVRDDIRDFEADDVATAQLAIDGEIEKGQIPLPPGEL